jgi:LmbE family N-acetylglucosaminyl deacetylase
MSKQARRRILAIGAHPDDIDLGCAGTLARCVERGDSVTIAVACLGDSASCGLPPDELARVRSREAAASAAVLGADLIEMGLPDGGVQRTPAVRDLFTDVIRRARPDVLITHFHSDYGSDHNNALTLAVDAALNAIVGRFKTAHAPIPKQPLIFMMEPLSGYGFQPQVYVDISGTFAVKRKMLACHTSQFKWMRRYGGMDFQNYIDVVARFRGYQCGVERAEGFIAHPSFGHIAAGSVLP